MKRLPGVKETNIPLNTVSLDLRSPAGKTGESYFRLIVNALSERNGRLRRLGGWRALSLNKSTDQNITFAIVGDQGWGTQPEADVAAMIKTWNPSFIATVGDNIYGANTGMTLAQANALFASTNTVQYVDFIALRSSSRRLEITRRITTQAQALMPVLQCGIALSSRTHFRAAPRTTTGSTITRVRLSFS